MSQIKTQAYVLKSINWKDTSKIVSLYTREKGRVDVIAKGIRRKNHPQSVNFEALNLLETIIYFSDKRELQNIGETTLINSYHKIRIDLEKKGQIIGPLDVLIAGTALAHNLILVTRNQKEFGRINYLRVENWY